MKEQQQRTISLDLGSQSTLLMSCISNRFAFIMNVFFLLLEKIATKIAPHRVYQVVPS
jgi:hypothetical protein